MAFPVIVLIGGAAAAAALLLMGGEAKAAPPPAPAPKPKEPHTTDSTPGRGSASKPGGTAPAPKATPAPAVIAVDPGMPAAAAAELQRLLSVTTDPDRLEAVAVLLDRSGYPIAAATVRAYAAALRARGGGAVLGKVETVLTTEVPPPPPALPASLDYRIKDQSEVPYILARRFTGDANRWREILPLNPTLKVVQKKDAAGKITTTLVEPWYPGLVVKLPGAWLAAALSQRAAA
jgi:hypothetical protein